MIKRAQHWSYLLMFALVNVLVLYLLGLRYITDLQIPQTHIIQLYLVLLYIGHIGIISLITLCLLPGILQASIRPFCSSKWLVLLLPVIIISGILFYCIIDAFIYSDYHFHFNGFFFKMLLSGAGRDIFQFSGTEWAVTVILIFAIISFEAALAYWLWKKIVIQQRQLLNRLSKIICISVITLSYLGSHVINAWGYYVLNSQVLEISQVLPFYYGLTAYSFINRHRLIDPKLRRPHRSLYTASNRQLNYPLQPLHTTKKKTLPNILFLVIDTWRADTMNKKTSPNIANFAATNWNFTNHWSAGDCTQPGIFSLFYSIPASYWASFLIKQKTPVFIDELQKLGYTMFIHGSANLTVPPFNKTVFAQVKNLQVASAGNNSWQRDTYINNKLLSFLASPKAKSKPFFGFLFYDAVHGFSYPPNMKLQFKPVWNNVDHLALNNNFDPTPYFNIYKNAVYFDDNLVAKVIERLKNEGLLKNTIVIITADHGNEFNDNHHNYWGHASNFTAAQMHIPLIIHWPGSTAKTINSYTSHYDIVPTLMTRALGVTNKTSDYSVGHDLLSGNTWKFLLVSSYQRMGLIDRKLIVTFFRGGYFTTTDAHLNRTKNSMNNLFLHQAFKQMQKFYKK